LTTPNRLNQRPDVEVFLHLYGCIVPHHVSFAQDSTKITNAKGDTIDFGTPDLQLKYIPNNEFSRLITANSDWSSECA